jgi:ribosomal protein S12
MEEKKKDYAYLGGQNARSELKKFDIIYIRGGRRRDLPAMKYTAVRRPESYAATYPNKFLPLSSKLRRNARSKYAIRKILD